MLIAQVADAVKDTINNASLSQPVTATRTYHPQFELSEMLELHVTVVPRQIDSALVARNRSSVDVTVDVGVQKRFDKGDAAEIDPLVHLLEEIEDLFRGKRLAEMPDAVWVSSDFTVVAAPEHWQQQRQFTSVLALTFRVWK